MCEEFLEERPAWYAIYTKPMAESRVDSNLRAWQLETLAPKIKVRHDYEFTGKPVLCDVAALPAVHLRQVQAQWSDA